MAWYLFKVTDENESHVDYSVCTCVDVHVPLLVTTCRDVAEELGEGGYHKLSNVSSLPVRDGFFRIVKTIPSEVNYSDIQNWMRGLPITGYVWWFPAGLHGNTFYAWFEDDRYHDIMMIKWGDCLNG